MKGAFEEIRRGRSELGQGRLEQPTSSDATHKPRRKSSQTPLLVEERAEFLNEHLASLEIRVRYYARCYARRHIGTVIQKPLVKELGTDVQN